MRNLITNFIKAEFLAIKKKQGNKFTLLLVKKNNCNTNYGITAATKLNALLSTYAASVKSTTKSLLTSVFT